MADVPSLCAPGTPDKDDVPSAVPSAMPSAMPSRMPSTMPSTADGDIEENAFDFQTSAGYHGGVVPPDGALNWWWSLSAPDLWFFPSLRNSLARCVCCITCVVAEFPRPT